MRHTVYSFTGWQQAAEALRAVYPSATAVDYQRYDSVDAVWEALPTAECDAVIGWSLGGQMALRAISEGKLTARRLVLIATPYHLPTPPEMMRQYCHAPGEILTEFAALCALGDVQRKAVKAGMCKEPNATGEAWLRILSEFHGDAMQWQQMPPTLIIHGKEDVIVPVEQAQQLAEHIAVSELRVLPQCGHAPHLHDKNTVKQLVGEWIRG